VYCQGCWLALNTSSQAHLVTGNNLLSFHRFHIFTCIASGRHRFINCFVYPSVCPYARPKQFDGTFCTYFFVISNWLSILALLTNYYLVLIKLITRKSSLGRISVCLCLWRTSFWSSVGISGASWVLFGTPRPPSPHHSLHSSPFYLKGPRTAVTGKPTETRGHPGCNDKSKDHPRAHERRKKPLQDLSFRYPWDSVSRSHKTSKFCMPHTRPCGTPYTHNAPTIYFDIP
jgi:hypothetical protein